MNKLYSLFSEVLEDTEYLLKRTEQAENTLAALFRTVLREQKMTIEQLLPQLQEQNKELQEFKSLLSIIYHDDTVSNSTFRAWGRAIVWQDEKHKQAVEDLTIIFQRMKKNLEEAGSELKEVFGEKKVKYVVPAFYLS